MKTNPTSILPNQKPILEIEIKLYQDRNGNYFAQVSEDRVGNSRCFWTSTYTISSEPLREALDRINSLEKRK